MKKASEKLAKGRAGLILDMPFFGSLALRLKLVEDLTCPTAWTDGKSMGYNPRWIESLSLDEIKGIICHEVMHCANQHQNRRGEREKERWNKAADLAINPMIIDCGLVLPKGGLIDSQFHDMSSEAIYTRLPQDDSSGGQSGQPGQAGGSGQGGDGNQGSDPGGCGEVRDAPGEDGKPSSPAGKEQNAQEWNVAVAQAAQQSKAAGDFPSSLDRLVNEVLNPKVDWREALRRFVDTAARNDYRWFPPNRRHIHNGLYLPSVRSEELGKVVTVVDTSGSIASEDVDQFAAEMTSILEEYKADCIVIYCDAAVAGVEHIPADDLPLHLEPKGGGGTDFRPPFEYVAEHGEIPACLVYFTDGYCNDFPEEPEYPTLWVVTDGMRDFNPPFGEVIVL